MKDTRKRLARIAAALTLIALVALAFQISSARQQDNHNVTPPPATYNDNGSVGIPYNKACRDRCARSYRRCLRAGKGARACRRQQRSCLQRCPQ